MKRFSMRAFVLVFACLAGLAMCRADELAAVTGLVTDPNGRSVPGVTILITNLSTNVGSRSVTNDQGIYRIANLQPGIYRITLDKDGFKSIVKSGVELQVQDVASINFELQMGSVNETVTVEAGGLVINTTDATVGTVVDRQFVENIPLNGRSFQSLITLTPGVVVVPAGTTNTGGQFSVNGQRASANSFTVDGVSANFGASPGNFGGAQSSGNLPGLTAFGTTQSLVSVDALQEFKVQTSSYAAEYGQQPGGQISIVTRSGTNQFHGNLFDYFRNDVLDANDWFADRAGQPKPPERQNDFGGTLGGPVVIPGLYNGRDRTFFFFSYEGLRLRLPQFNLTNVPSLALRQTAPAAVQPILNAFPLPNGKTLANGLAEFSAGYSDPSNLDAASVRIDHTVNRKLTLFGRYNRAPSEGVIRRANVNLATFQTNRLNAQTVTLGATSLLTPRISNELRANYSDNRAYQSNSNDGFGGATVPPPSVFIPSQYQSGESEGAVTLNFPGITSAAPPSAVVILGNGVTTQRQFNIVDNLSYGLGSHQLKFGVDYRRLTPVDSSFYLLVNTFSSQQQVLAATAGIGSLSDVITRRPIFLNFSAYGQDSWRVFRRLTLDLGLRWDVNPPPSEANGNNQLAVTQVDNLATMQLAPIGTKPWKTTYNNFAPRLGVAYQASQVPGRETVVRGGFGVFYDAGNDQGANNFNGPKYPFSSVKSLSNVVYPLSPTQVAPPPFPFQTGFTPPYGSNLAIFDPALKLPYTLQWNVALERSLGTSQAFTLSYVGAAGRRMLQQSFLIIGAINPKFTSIFLTKNNATSDYDALQAQFQRRLSRGLQGLISYTWSHALDDDSSSATARNAQHGNAAFDVRHVFAAAATYDIPWRSNHVLTRAALGGWSIDSSVHAQSGLPVDLVAAVVQNPADGSFFNVRPNVITGVPFYLSGADCTASNGGVPCPGGRRINPAAFKAPATGQSGNFGRNQVRGLGAWQIDSALRKQFNLTEKTNLQFRAEAFNVLNHPNFGSVQTSLTAANFGQPTNMLNRQLGGISQLYQIGGPRSLQLALKLLF